MVCLLFPEPALDRLELGLRHAVAGGKVTLNGETRVSDAKKGAKKGPMWSYRR